MRHDAWRRDAASYPLRGELLPRYTDVDVWQHLNNSALISMHGESVQHALRSVFGPDAWRRSQPVLAAVSGATDFLAEAYYPEPLGWGARVLAVDGDGVRVAAALFQHGRCVGLHETVVAGWADGRPVGLGADAVASLRAAGVPGADTVDPLHGPSDRASDGPAPDHFPARTTLAMRFGDSDARRFASDAVLARAAEQMRVEFLGRVFAARPRRTGGMMVAHVALRWLHRGAPGPRWEGGCGVAHVGDRSLAMRGAVFDAGRCVASCDSVMVAIDPETRRSAPLPDDARALLEAQRVRAHPPENSG